jgi:hypothetical protein
MPETLQQFGAKGRLEKLSMTTWRNGCAWVNAW